jgi:hypothetical protein
MILGMLLPGYAAYQLGCYQVAVAVSREWKYARTEEG